jgi:hypothetical protein
MMAGIGEKIGYTGQWRMASPEIVGSWMPSNGGHGPVPACEMGQGRL